MACFVHVRDHGRTRNHDHGDARLFRRLDKYICLNDCQNSQQEDRNKGKIGIFHIDIFC